MSLLNIRNLKKTFGQQNVLNGINLEVEQGQLICIIGRSGCGKSTLLRCMNGLENFESGSIQVGHHELVGGPSQNKKVVQKIRHDVGFVFQQFQLFSHLSLIENIMMAPQVVQKIPVEDAKKRADSLLERVGLTEHAFKKPSQLSGGQQQRGAI